MKKKNTFSECVSIKMITAEEFTKEFANLGPSTISGFSPTYVIDNQEQWREFLQRFVPPVSLQEFLSRVQAIFGIYISEQDGLLTVIINNYQTQLIFYTILAEVRGHTLNGEYIFRAKDNYFVFNYIDGVLDSGISYQTLLGSGFVNFTTYNYNENVEIGNIKVRNGQLEREIIILTNQDPSLQDAYIFSREYNTEIRYLLKYQNNFEAVQESNYFNNSIKEKTIKCNNSVIIMRASYFPSPKYNRVRQYTAKFDFLNNIPYEYGMSVLYYRLSHEDILFKKLNLIPAAFILAVWDEYGYLKLLATTYDISDEPSLVSSVSFHNDIYEGEELPDIANLRF